MVDSAIKRIVVVDGAAQCRQLTPKGPLVYKSGSTTAVLDPKTSSIRISQGRSSIDVMVTNPEAPADLYVQLREDGSVATKRLVPWDNGQETVQYQYSCARHLTLGEQLTQRRAREAGQNRRAATEVPESDGRCFTLWNTYHTLAFTVQTQFSIFKNPNNSAEDRRAALLEISSTLGIPADILEISQIQIQMAIDSLYLPPPCHEPEAPKKTEPAAAVPAPKPAPAVQATPLKPAPVVTAPTVPTPSPEKIEEPDLSDRNLAAQDTPPAEREAPVSGTDDKDAAAVTDFVLTGTVSRTYYQKSRRLTGKAAITSKVLNLSLDTKPSSWIGFEINPKEKTREVLAAILDDLVQILDGRGLSVGIVTQNVAPVIHSEVDAAVMKYKGGRVEVFGTHHIKPIYRFNDATLKFDTSKEMMKGSITIAVLDPSQLLSVGHFYTHQYLEKLKLGFENPTADFDQETE